MAKRLGLALVLLGVALVARAEVPAFTPNVVDPGHRLTEGDRAVVEDAIRALRGVDVWAAVYVADELSGQSIEALSRDAFARWQLGERGKNNGLLLVMAMVDRKMRFEVGYGLEAVFPDALCRRALDEQLRPALRQGRIADGIVDALAFLGHEKDSGFTIAGRAPPARHGFDARGGGVVWGAWIAFIFWLSFIRRKYVFDSRVVSFIFFTLNPGVFIFIGAAFLSGYRDLVLGAAVHFALAHLALPPFYALVGLAVGYPIRLYARRAREAEAVLYHGRPMLRALDDKWRRITKEARTPFDGRVMSTFLGIFTAAVVLTLGLVFELDYRQPPFFLIPVGLYLLTMRICKNKVAVFATAEARTADLERRIRDYQVRMDRLVQRGHASRNDDGTYVYTAAYYAAQSSSDSSSSSSSSSDSSSGGGSSGGGGASSDW
jgi:uncharacterized membrane protein YgcG